MSVGTVVDVVLVVAVVMLATVVLALARELGRVQTRLGPVGARTTNAGPGTGRPGPRFSGLVDHLGREHTLGGQRDDGRATLIMFIGPSCSVCKSLLPGLRTIAKSEPKLDVVLVGDGEPAEHAEFVRTAKLPTELPYIVSAEVGMKYRAGVVPYGVVLDSYGIVRSKGLCNHLHQVESLLNALDLGVSTLSDLAPAAVG